MKTPEEMAEEYVAHNRSYPYDPLNAQDRYMRNSYLVGFKTAKADTARDFNDLMKDLSKRIDESCLPAMDALEGRYLYQIKQLETRIKELEVELENWQENAKHGDEGL